MFDMRLLANALSMLLHPLWMTTGALVLCSRIDPFMFLDPGSQAGLIFLGLVFLMTALFPLVSTLLMRRSGLVSDLTLPTRSERIPVYIIGLLYHGMCWYLVRRITDHPVTLGIVTSTSAAASISRPPSMTTRRYWWPNSRTAV